MTKKSIRNKSKRDKQQDYLSNIYDVGGAINISEWYNQNKNLNSPQLSQSGLPSSYETGIKYGNNNTNNNQGGLSGDVNWNQVGNVALGALLSGTSGIIGNAIGGGKTSGVGKGISNIGSTVGGALSAVNPILGGVVSLGSNVLGGGINALFGSDLNEERIAQAQNEINKAKSFNVNASNFDDLSQQIASQPIIAGFNQKDIGSDGWFSNKAKNKYKSLLAQKEYAENWIDRSIANAATNLQQQQMNNLLQNYAAYGGLLDMNNQYSNGGDLNGNNSNNSNSGLLSKTQELLDNIGYGNTPLSTIVPEEYKNIADGVWGGLEMFTPLGTIMGAADVANDIRNIYHKGNISSSDLGNLMLDSSGFIPGGKVLKKAAKSLSKVLPKKAEKLYTFADNLTYTTPKGIKEVKKRVTDAKDFSKKAEKAAMNALIIKNRNEALDAAMKIREASRFNQGILGGVDKALDSNAIQYNTTKNILQKADAINDTFGIMGNVENELNKKSFGGDLLTNGTVFSNGVTTIGNGGTHEESPYEGVQMGVDPQGIPNLVEEGETVWNDYVFSNRIPVPNAVRNKYKLRDTKDMSFSDAAKKIQKASEERPNDPIAQDTLDINLSRLAQEQETIREQRNMNNKNTFKKGGPKKSKIPAFTLTIGKDDFIDPRLDKAQLAQSNPLGLTKDDFAEVGMVDKDPYENITFNNNHNNNNNTYATWLRYAPVLGSTLGLSQTLLSSPNYSRADALAQYAQNAGKITPISYDPIDTMLTYKPVDQNYIANRMAAQAAATRRNIMNTSGGNRANAVGSLLAADYNAQIAQADAIRQGEDTNWNRLMQTQTFNRGTKQTNAEMALKAAMANQEARLKAGQMGLSGYTTAMQMKDAIDAQRNASINANLSSLFESLGNIGVDEYNRADRDRLIRAGVFGTLSEKPQEWSQKRWEDYKKALNGTGYRNGGKLKKKRGGFTY